MKAFSASNPPPLPSTLEACFETKSNKPSLFLPDRTPEPSPISIHIPLAPRSIFEPTQKKERKVEEEIVKEQTAVTTKALQKVVVL